MKPLLLAFFLGAATLATPAFTQTSAATEVDTELLHLSGAFIRATLPRAPVGGGYLTIVNHGAEDDRLLEVTAPVGDEVQIHDMNHKDGVMTMRALPDGLPIPAGETVVLEPSGTHLMIMGLTERLEEGQTYDLTLLFEKAGSVTLRFDVLALNARSHPGMDDGAKTHDHMNHDSSHGEDGHAAHAGHADGFDQTHVEGDENRIVGLLKDMFETPDAPLAVAPILIDGDIAIIGWMQEDAGGRALLRRGDHGLWRISLCAGDGLKGQANMISLGIAPEAAARLATAQAREEATLAPEHLAKLSLFDGVMHIDPEEGHDAQGH